jgi:putative ABC transport system permease protein
MFRLALKNLAANKIRLGLTALAIVLGVGFVVSSFVLRDGLKDSFAGLSEEIVGDTDFGITPLSSGDVSAFEIDESIVELLTEEDLEIVRGVDGVRIAEGSVSGNDNGIQPIKADGSTIPTNGPPQIGFSWGDEGQLNPLVIVEGDAPESPGEWVIDLDAAADHGFVIGETTTFVTPGGRKDATLVGTFRFGEDNTTNGATLMAFELSTARDFFETPEGFDSIAVAVDGSVPIADVELALNAALDSERILVQNQADLLAEQQGNFNLFVDIFGYILLAFALIALFVSIFIIANTFAIVTSQRIRELGLLRAIGATPSQIRRSVLIESTIIGLIASAIGLAVGVAIAFFMRWLLGQLGIPLPSFGVVIRPLTVIVAFVVGTVVTVVSAIVPAFSASKIAPITAITGTQDKAEKSAARYVIGGIITGVGALLIGLGLFAGSTALEVLAPLGAGAAILFVGLTLLSPLVAGPLSRVLGIPLGPIFKRPGSLATQNAARNPRRTATTAAALMIGLALVSMAMVLGESFKAEFSKVLGTTIQADYIISGEANLPLEVVDRLQDADEFDAVSPAFYWGADFENAPVVPTSGRVGDDGTGSNADVAAFDYSVVDALFDFEVTEGALTGITDDHTAIRQNVADELGLGLGDTLTMRLDDGTTAPMEVVGIFQDETISSGVLISIDRFSQISDQTTADLIVATRNADTTVDDADATFETIAADYPNLSFDSAASFRESFTGFIDGVLNVLTALLGLAIVIALIGIANTMALSVFERTREIGLLRAVGMTRRQTRRMIRWESAIIAAVGAVLGAIIGAGLGAVALAAIPGDIITTVTVPWVRIIAMVVIASLAGLAAALFPAFRASRMNVLEAISTN